MTKGRQTDGQDKNNNMPPNIQSQGLKDFFLTRCVCETRTKVTIVIDTIKIFFDYIYRNFSLL